MKSIDSNLAAGLTYLGIAAAFAIPALDYGMGSGLRLGAGVFPFVVSLLLAAVGAALVVAALRSPDRGEARVPVLPFDVRAMVCVMAALVFGAWTLRRFGIVVAVPGAILISSLASKEISWRGAALLAVFLTAFVWVVFVGGLGVRLPFFRMPF